jgi:diadenosine tetraphosphate (Ap4A) HIT family hydrolase
VSSGKTVVDCELCRSAGGELLWQDELCRVVLVAEPDYPGFCRVIWQRHVAEMSDLAAADRRHVMHVVNAVELAVRTTMRPDKINLASFGNMTPHLHWHVIPRWRDDVHFPQAIWGVAQRAPTPRAAAVASDLTRAIVQALAAD